MRILRIFSLLLLTFSGFAQNLDNPVTTDLSKKAPGALPELKVAARGTGRTTGHIITLTVHNPTGNASTFDLPACYIPATGKYQPYVVPYSPTISVGPGETADIPLQGFCTDIHTPPVPSGEAMTPVDTWVFPDPGVPVGTYFNPDGAAWAPVPTDAGSTVVPVVPGTNTPWPYTLDTGKDPDATAGIFLAVIDRIRHTYDDLHRQDLISTPFSGNDDREKESVVQQTFWIYTAAITGTGYDKDDFTQQTIRQYENFSGKPISAAPPEAKEKMDEGIDQFWGTFQAVGVEAKIIAVPEGGGSSRPDLLDKKDEKKEKPKGKCACTSMELDLALNIQNKVGNMIADADRTQTANFAKGETKVKLKKIKASASNVEVGKKVELTVTPTLECGCSEAGGKCPPTGTTTVTIKHKKEELKDEFSIGAVPYEIVVTVSKACGSDDCKEETCIVEIPILIEKDKKK